jgi:hypothetical protein
MSTDNPAAEAPQTTEVEVWVEWQDLQGQQQDRCLTITLQRPAAILNPTLEESYALETKLFQLIPIPWQRWVSLVVRYPSSEDFVEVYERTDRSADVLRSLRQCQNNMWGRDDDYPTGRFHQNPGISMILDLVIDREAVTDWLERVPVTRHLNLKLPKILRDEQIRKMLKMLAPVQAVRRFADIAHLQANLQFADIADEEDDEQDDAAQQAALQAHIQAAQQENQATEEEYRRAVARVTGMQASPFHDFGPKQTVWVHLQKHLQGFIQENDTFLSVQPEPHVGSHQSSYQWSHLLADRFRALMECVEEFMLFLNPNHTHQMTERQREVRFRDCKAYLAQSYIALLLHTFDVPIKEPARYKEMRFRFHRNGQYGQYMVWTFCPDDASWELQPDYKDNDRRLHYQQQQAYTTFLQDCALFMLVHPDVGAQTLSSDFVDSRLDILLDAYNNLLEQRTEEDELSTQKMTDFAVHYAKKRPPRGRDELGKRRFEDLHLLLDQLKACLSVY